MNSPSLGLPFGWLCHMPLKPVPFFSRYVHDKRWGSGKIYRYPPKVDFSAGLLDDFKLFVR
jgi:hypothetical protein